MIMLNRLKNRVVDLLQYKTSEKLKELKPKNVSAKWY